MDIAGDDTPRWHYRFDNFRLALARLGQLVETGRERALSEVEKEALIQRFEYSWELGWKLLADYVAANGVVLDFIGPRPVIRAAFAAGLIEDGDAWMAALEDRNRTTHTYHQDLLDKVTAAIQARYHAIFLALERRLAEERGG